MFVERARDSPGNSELEICRDYFYCYPRATNGKYCTK